MTKKDTKRYVVYLEKPTPKNSNNIFESKPGAKLKKNEGVENCLNMDISIVEYNKSDVATSHFKECVKYLPRTQHEKEKLYTYRLGQNDHSIRKKRAYKFGNKLRKS